jgi:phospholipase/carboxylesterase
MLSKRLVFPAGHNPRALVVLLHGFGAPGTDLVPLAEVFDVDEDLGFVFPAAPLALGGMFGDGRAWWMIDLARLERDLMTGRATDRASEIPDGLPEARAEVMALLDALSAEHQVPPERIILGGFSQGAMLALDVALHRQAPVAGLVLMSGTLIARPLWEKRLSQHPGMKVFMSHGRRDPLLPYAAAEVLRDLLCDAGMTVSWQPFDGAHEIPPAVIAGASRFMTDCLRPH